MFTDLTPHWLVGGRSGAGKTAFLMNVLYGLCTRYDPDELALYLLDFKPGGAFARVRADRATTRPGCRTPAWSAWTATASSGLAVLRELDAS